MSALSCGVSPDCESMNSSSQCEGVNLVVATFLPFKSSTDLMVLRLTMPSPPRLQSCWMMARAFRPFSASSLASRE